MPAAEIKICQSCHANFSLTSEDKNFYKKIEVPPPTFCTNCRHRRRFAWRNERTLYKRKCDVPGHNEELISVFSPDKRLRVYDDRYWWSDAWDPLSYGREYDFSRSFFEQYRELLERVPLIALSVTNMSNCNYCNVSQEDKDCYLVSASEGDERVRYANRIVYTKDSADLYISDRNELGYELINCSQCYRVAFARDSSQCSDSTLLYDCVGCSNCFGCAGLRKKSYYIFNEPYSKEDYVAKIKELNLGSFRNMQAAKTKFEDLLLRIPRRYAHVIRSLNVIGDNVVGSRNCMDCFDAMELEDSAAAIWAVKAKGVRDAGPGVGLSLETAYEVTDSGIQGSRLFFTNVVYGSHDVYYSINCHASANLFGCYGVRGSEYCILNKSYSREEYEALLPQIREQMENIPYVDRKGRTYRYGEFFPEELSLFAYNETIAEEYFPLTKEQAVEQGFSWYDRENRNYQVTIRSTDLPDNIKDSPDSILDQVIGCGDAGNCNHQCSSAYRLILEELEFYRRFNLPLPRFCPNCRHYKRLEQRNPMKLWHRTCQCAGVTSETNAYKNIVTHAHEQAHCLNSFETTYAPERPEIVYCESCYQSEIS